MPCTTTALDYVRGVRVHLMAKNKEKVNLEWCLSAYLMFVPIGGLFVVHLYTLYLHKEYKVQWNLSIKDLRNKDTSLFRTLCMVPLVSQVPLNKVGNFCSRKIFYPI